MAVRLVFEQARRKRPSIIIIDEADALLRKRSGRESDAERRMKTELLNQLGGGGSISVELDSDCYHHVPGRNMNADGGKRHHGNNNSSSSGEESSDNGYYVNGNITQQSHRNNNNNNNEGVFVVAATNVPWELDVAALRRFEKRINVQLPDTAARQDLFSVHTLLAERRLQNMMFNQSSLEIQEGKEEKEVEEEDKDGLHLYCGMECPRPPPRFPRWKEKKGEGEESEEEREELEGKERIQEFSPGIKNNNNLNQNMVLAKVTASEAQLLSERSQGYSGSDIAAVVKEALRAPVLRRISGQNPQLPPPPTTTATTTTTTATTTTPCDLSRSGNEREEGNIREEKKRTMIMADREVATMEDFTRALRMHRPTINRNMARIYRRFDARFGSCLNNDDAMGEGKEEEELLLEKRRRKKGKEKGKKRKDETAVGGAQKAEEEDEDEDVAEMYRSMYM